MTFLVMRRRCKTCIYRKGLGWNLKKLEGDVADRRMKGFFSGFRVCHSQKLGGNACCRGFWDHHKWRFTLGQIAQRFGLVEYVEPKED
jgi:hypothetical protein